MKLQKREGESQSDDDGVVSNDVYKLHSLQVSHMSCVLLLPINLYNRGGAVFVYLLPHRPHARPPRKPIQRSSSRLRVGAAKQNKLQFKRSAR